MPNLRGAVKTAAGRLGLEITRVGGQATKHQQRARLLDHLGVTLVLDVGANVGQYAGIHLRSWTGYQGRIASFELVDASYRACAWAAREDDDWATFAYGLSDVDGITLPVNVPEGQTDLSSLHDLTPEGVQMTRGSTTRVEHALLHRLDAVIGQIALPDDRLALKLDVQGHEAAVLRGGHETLARTVLVECEMPLVAMYKGQGTFAELLALLERFGFSPVGMHSNYVDPSTGCAMDADVFLLRR